jgi:hypothetical protein
MGRPYNFKSALLFVAKFTSKNHNPGSVKYVMDACTYVVDSFARNFSTCPRGLYNDNQLFGENSQ